MPQAKVALIDWDLQALSSGLLMPPTEPRELFWAVARRLGQLYGVEALDPYWIAEARVNHAAAEHQDLIRHFQRGLADWTAARSRTVGPDVMLSGEQKDDVLKNLLLKEGLWNDDQSELRRNIDGARRDPEWEYRLRQRGSPAAEAQRSKTWRRPASRTSCCCQCSKALSAL